MENMTLSPISAPIYNNLCSNTDQVRHTKINPLQIKKLCKDSVEDWLEENGYPAIAYAIRECGSTFIHLRDQNSHEKYVRMYCRNDFCPTCGASGSQNHKRRTIRALDRLIWADILGYMVFTLPKEVSEQRPDKEGLYYLSKKAWQIIKQNFATPGGVVRTHLMGEEPENLHIHINVLFPVLSQDGLGKVSQDVLDKVRGEWTVVVNDFFELKCENTNVFYKFALQAGKQFHQVKYVLRPVVTAEKFLTLSDEDKRYILSLKGWHNTRWFGKLANSQYKKFLESKGFKPTACEDKDIDTAKRCPICGERYRFVGIVHKDELPKNQLELISEATYADLETYFYLLSKR